MNSKNSTTKTGVTGMYFSSTSLSRPKTTRSYPADDMGVLLMSSRDISLFLRVTMDPFPGSVKLTTVTKELRLFISVWWKSQ